MTETIEPMVLDEEQKKDLAQPLVAHALRGERRHGRPWTPPDGHGTMGHQVEGRAQRIRDRLRGAHQPLEHLENAGLRPPFI